MTNEELCEKVSQHEILITTHAKDISELKENNKTLNKLVTNVELIAQSTNQIVEEQKKQGERLEKIEREPAEKWNSAKKTAFTAIVSTIAGALAVALIMLLATTI